MMTCREEEFASAVAGLCVAKLRALPKSGRAGGGEWTVLAGIVQRRTGPHHHHHHHRTHHTQHHGPAGVMEQTTVIGKESSVLESTKDIDQTSEGVPDYSELKVVALGTGSKCLGTSRWCAKGTLVHDGHAEVLTKRCFQLYLMDQMEEAYCGRESVFTLVSKTNHGPVQNLACSFGEEASCVHEHSKGEGWCGQCSKSEVCTSHEAGHYKTEPNKTSPTISCSDEITSSSDSFKVSEVKTCLMDLNDDSSVPKQRLLLAEGVSFHMYVSHTPCGDCSIFPKDGSDDTTGHGDVVTDGHNLNSGKLNDRVCGDTINCKLSDVDTVHDKNIYPGHKRLQARDCCRDIREPSLKKFKAITDVPLNVTVEDSYTRNCLNTTSHPSELQSKTSKGEPGRATDLQDKTSKGEPGRATDLQDKTSKGEPGRATDLQDKTSKGEAGRATDLQDKTSKGEPGRATDLQDKTSKGEPGRATDLQGKTSKGEPGRATDLQDKTSKGEPGRAPHLADLHRTGAKVVMGAVQDPHLPGILYHKTGALRTKPGRGDPCLSHCCSDKLFKWTVMGLQGNLLSPFTQTPIYLTSLIIGSCPFSSEAMERGLFSRFKEQLIKYHSTSPLFKLSRVKILKCDVDFDHSRSATERRLGTTSVTACPSSVTWYPGYGARGSQVIVNGRKLGVTKKGVGSVKSQVSVCRYQVMAKVVKLHAICRSHSTQVSTLNVMLENSSESKDQVQGGLSYKQLKNRSHAYNKAWNLLRQTVLTNWTVKPDHLQDFVL